MELIPTLTIRQPWADLILLGIKDVENRTWSTAHRGRLLIHSAATVDKWAFDHLERGYGITLSDDYEPHTGAILGEVELVECVTEHRSSFFTGPYGFMLRNPLRFAEPLPYKGQLRIFGIPEGLVRSATAETHFLESPGAVFYGSSASAREVEPPPPGGRAARRRAAERTDGAFPGSSLFA